MRLWRTYWNRLRHSRFAHHAYYGLIWGTLLILTVTYILGRSVRDGNLPIHETSLTAAQIESPQSPEELSRPD